MAGNQIEIVIPTKTVEEQSAFDATVYIRDRSLGQGADPGTSLEYRIDNLTNQEAKRDWTTISLTGAAEYTVSVRGSDNAIGQNVSFRAGGSDWEVVEMIVSMDRGLDTEVNQAVRWRVMKRFGI